MDPLSVQATTQQFEVLCIKVGKSSLNCLPEDLKRYPTTADSPLQARFAVAETVEKDGYTVLQTVTPGFITEVERHARIRASEQSLPQLDKSRI